MGKKSRTKGANFERQIAKILSAEFGVTLRRTPLSGGWAKDSNVAAGDIVCVDDDAYWPFCIECKNAEGWRFSSLLTDKHSWFDNWLRQARDECPPNKKAILIFSKNYTPIFAARPLSDVGNIALPYAVIDVDGKYILICLLSQCMQAMQENLDEKICGI